MKIKLNKYGKKMKHDMYRNSSPGQIQCVYCHRYMSPQTLYEKGEFFLPGRDFCPECRETFYITPYKAAMLNKVIAEENKEQQQEERMEREQQSLLPVRDNHEKVDLRDIPDAY